MSTLPNQALPNIGARQEARGLEVPAGCLLHLSVHICPLGFVTWRLVERATEQARYGTLANVDMHGRSVPLRLETAGEYELTWAAACATQAWFACSVIHCDGAERYRETVQRNDDLTPILFGYGIRVTG